MTDIINKQVRFKLTIETGDNDTVVYDRAVLINEEVLSQLGRERSCDTVFTMFAKDILNTFKPTRQHDR
jgi:hypothetical protein